jgi:hypothetical protein
VSYKSHLEAVRHINRYHFCASLDGGNATDLKVLEVWLRDSKQSCIDHRLEMYLHYLGLVLDPLKEIYSRGRNIWDGVASGQGSMSSQVMLPKSLVEAFEHTILLLVYAARSFFIIDRYSSLMTQRSKESEFKIEKDLNLLKIIDKRMSSLANRAKECMHKAEQDIIILAYTDTGATETISYDSVGPEYLLATIVANLLNRPLYQGEQIDMVYAGFYRRLVSRPARFNKYLY